MLTMESLTEAIPPQCRDCTVLQQRLERVRQRMDNNTAWAIGRALPALTLAVSREDAQQERLAEEVVVNDGTDSYLRMVSQAEVDRRIAQSYLRGMEYHNEHAILGPAIAELGLIQVVCPGPSSCYLSENGVSPQA
jgi:hypothetical protein